MSTVLLVDDDPEILGYLAAWVERDGYGALTASDGHRALDILDSEA